MLIQVYAGLCGSHGFVLRPEQGLAIQVVDQVGDLEGVGTPESAAWSVRKSCDIATDQNVDHFVRLSYRVGSASVAAKGTVGRDDAGSHLGRRSNLPAQCLEEPFLVARLLKPLGTAV